VKIFIALLLYMTIVPVPATMSYAFLWRLRALASQSFLLHAIAFYIRCLSILIWMFHESIFRPVHDRSWAIINSHLLAQTVMKRSVTIKLKYLITLRVTAFERTDTEGYDKTTGDGLGHGTKSHLRVNSIQAIFWSFISWGRNLLINILNFRVCPLVNIASYWWQLS